MRARAIFVAAGIFRPADSGRTEDVPGGIVALAHRSLHHAPQQRQKNLE
jgi:hypothetical protein